MLAVTLLAVRLVEIRVPVAIFVPAPALVPHDRLVLTDDDVQAFREFAREMDRQATTDAAHDAVRRFDQFVNQLSDEQLNRQEAFRRLQALQDELERGRETDREDLRDALREAGNRMDENRTTQQLTEALRHADPQAAAQAMHQLAEQLRQNRMSEEQRQQLQQALQHAMQQRNQEQLDQQLQRQRDEIERMLRQQREHQLSESEQRNLHQRQRDLEHLQHDQQHRDAQRRQLERLNRAMSQAMQDLARDLAQQAAQDLDQGAQDLNRMSNEQLSDQQVAELRQQLEDLRQRMREQNGQGGQQQRMRLQRFAGEARGGVMPGGMSPSGHNGHLRLGMGSGSGQRLQIPAGAGATQQGQNGGQEGRDPGGGVEAGTQHDEHIRGAATSLRGDVRTVNVSGQHREGGPTRSQIIRTAAQDGFTGQGYREVHESYWEHAREVVHAGDVPPGYRSYVRRYFQLIRPRDDE